MVNFAKILNMMKYLLSVATIFAVVFSLSFTNKNFFVKAQHPFSDTVHFPGETHFANVRQLTFGGDNAEDRKSVV